MVKTKKSGQQFYLIKYLCKIPNSDQSSVISHNRRHTCRYFHGFPFLSFNLNLKFRQIEKFQISAHNISFINFKQPSFPALFQKILMSLNKILGFSSLGFYLDVIEKSSNLCLLFSLTIFHTQSLSICFLKSAPRKRPLIWSIPFDSMTSGGFTIAVQSQKRATSGALGTKRLSTSGNQQVKLRD